MLRVESAALLHRAHQGLKGRFVEGLCFYCYFQLSPIPKKFNHFWRSHYLR